MAGLANAIASRPTASIRSANNHQRRTRSRLRFDSKRLVRNCTEGKTTLRGSWRAIRCKTTGMAVAAKPNSSVALRKVTNRKSRGGWNRLRKGVCSVLEPDLPESRLRPNNEAGRRAASKSESDVESSIRSALYRTACLYPAGHSQFAGCCILPDKLPETLRLV